MEMDLFYEFISALGSSTETHEGAVGMETSCRVFIL